MPGGEEKEHMPGKVRRSTRQREEEEGCRASQRKRLGGRALGSPPLVVATSSVCTMDLPGSSGDREAELECRSSNASGGTLSVSRPTPAACTGHELNKTGKRHGLGMPKRFPKNALGDLQQCGCVCYARQHSLETLEQHLHTLADNLFSRSVMSL